MRTLPYSTPELDLEDQQVIEAIGELRRGLETVLRVPRRWTGGLRRTTQARAIRGSNSIEGYVVTPQDALAAVDDEEPLSADERTWAEILGYRRVLTYVLQMAPTPGFQLDAHTLRTMHFMLLEHDLSVSPGAYRRGEIFVRDERSGDIVYQGPDPDLVPAAVEALTEQLQVDRDHDPIVAAAMAHLNLAMIHPFRDGNGRMARALQTLILARAAVMEPVFASIEEWLGANTDDYYAVLAVVGRGAWPSAQDADRDARLWVKFTLRAHHMQAETLARRFEEASELWSKVDGFMAEHGLPDRTGDPLFDAMLGLRVRRTGYVKRSGVEDRTATRDLARLTDLGLLEAHGATRARTYVAGSPLTAATAQVRASRRPVSDPYPWLPDEVRRLHRLNPATPPV